MPILIKRKNGEITPFRNAEYISAFYFIPKSILDKCGEEISSIPRNPRKLLQDRRAIEIVESDLFKLVIIDAYAFMVWPFMGLSAKGKFIQDMNRLGDMRTQLLFGLKEWKMKGLSLSYRRY